MLLRALFSNLFIIGAVAISSSNNASELNPPRHLRQDSARSNNSHAKKELNRHLKRARLLEDNQKDGRPNKIRRTLLGFGKGRALSSDGGTVSSPSMESLGSDSSGDSSDVRRRLKLGRRLPGKGKGKGKAYGFGIANGSSDDLDLSLPSTSSSWSASSDVNTSSPTASPSFAADDDDDGWSERRELASISESSADEGLSSETSGDE